MLPLVPSCQLKKKESCEDSLTITDQDGRKKYAGYFEDRVCETPIDGGGHGFFDEGIDYKITFKHCRRNCMVKVHVKNISIVFGPAYHDGPTISKESGEKILVQGNHKVVFSLTKEETLSLLPENRPEHRIPIKFDVAVENIYGNRMSRHPHYNFYEPNWDSTLALLFGDGKTMYANLTLLSLYSHYFKTLSEHLDDLPKDEKSGLPLLKLEDFQSRVFEDMLVMMYPSVYAHYFARRDTEEAFRLADYLQFETILSRYERYLISDENTTPMQKLLLSTQYGLSELQDTVVKQLKTIEEVEKLQKDRKFCELPTETVNLVLTRLLQISKNETVYDGEEYESEEEDA